ncbi:GNAT family N-acetyltransferase [Rhodococcus daqingensis]|uniref:GNAT family N-acetyltransferase n=1 Tax=Rhodococcus daqingensis TaxID=2479363 RepID=A0ABW2RXE5_9NOCA
MGDRAIAIRTATETDWDAVALLDAHAFGFHPTDEDMAFTRRFARTEDVILATDDDRPVAVVMHFPMRITVPGGTQLDLPGVSWVSVAPTHRRRGILRALFTEQHRRFVAAGAPLSILTATEATIYGRFGYGPATSELAVSVDRRSARIRDTAADPGGVALVPPAAARPALPGIYDRWQARTPGALARPPVYWDRMFADLEHRRDDASALFYLVHADGYAAYRRKHTPDGMVAVVDDLVAATDESYAALWRVLAGMDLMREIRVDQAADDPLPWLLTDARLPRVTSRDDAVWVRIMDVPAALTARSFAVDLDVVLEVHDPFLDAGGNFSLRVVDGRAAVTRTDAPPQARLDLDVLGSLYLGGHRARSFARAGRLWTRDEAVLDRLDLAFGTDREPFAGWHF